MIARCAVVAASLLASACVGAGVTGATYAVRTSQRDHSQAAAERGDAAAQYRVGLSYCCMGVGFSTQRASEWLCASALQGYAPAQYELGRIYSGEIARTPTPGQLVAGALIAKRDLLKAAVWFE